MIPLGSHWRLVVLVTAVSSCELAPTRTGSCQPALPLEVGHFQRAEAFHDDCIGPDGAGDLFTMSFAAQQHIELTLIPEQPFAPELAIYRGGVDDANPPLVARLRGFFSEPLGVRLMLAPGPYFVVAGTASRDRALYRVTSTTAMVTDCKLPNFITPGVTIDGFVTNADCEVDDISGEVFEMWREPGDSINLTIVAESVGQFRFGESCCELEEVVVDVFEVGDSVTVGHRAARRRPYRAQFKRDTKYLGVAAYRLRFH